MTGLSLAEARAYAAARGARLPTEDEWQLAAEAGLLERAEPLVWNWTESEHSDGRTRFAILKGGSAFRAEGSEWYVDGGAAAAGVLAAAAARGAAAALAAHRLPAGGRSVTRPLEGIRVVEAATLFAAPLAGMLLGDYGADVIKIEHPRRPDPARGHGPAKDGVGLWFKTLGRNKRLVTLDLSQPDGRDLFLRLAERADVVLENFRPGTLERWGLGSDELLGRQPAPRPRARQRLRAVRAVRAAARLRHARRGDERLRRAERRARRPAAAAAARARRRRRRARDGVRGHGRAARARGDRARAGRRHVADRAAADAARPAGRPRTTCSATLQPRTGNRSSHNAPRNVYRTADGALGRRLGQRRRRSPSACCASSAAPTSSSSRGSRPAPAARRTSTRSTRAVAAWIAERPRDEVLAAFEAAEAAIAPIYDARDIARRPAARRDRRDRRRSTTTSSARCR